MCQRNPLETLVQRSDVCTTDEVNLIFLVYPVCSPACLDAAAAYLWSCPQGTVSKQYQCDERIRRNSCRGYIRNGRYRIWHLCGEKKIRFWGRVLLYCPAVQYVSFPRTLGIQFISSVWFCFLNSIKSMPILILFRKIGFLYFLSIFRPLYPRLPASATLLLLSLL